MTTSSVRARTRWWALLALGLITLLLAWYELGRSVTTSFRTVELKHEDISQRVHAIGSLKPLSHVDVGAQVSGQVVHLWVQAGDVVEQGQLLLEIDPSVQQAIVDADQAAIAALQAQGDEQRAKLFLAEQKYQRQQQLQRHGATRLEAVQEAQAEVAMTRARIAHYQAQIEQRRASLRAEESRLGYTRIYAPMAGTITRVEAQVGQTLNATYQTPTVLTVADLSRMTVWAEVSEADIHQIRLDMPVQFSTLGNSGEQARLWHSHVRQILPAPSVSEEDATSAVQAVTYTVLFDIDNADAALRPMMTAQLSFLVAHAEQVLTVPLQAIEQLRDAAMVTILHSDQSLEQREVQVGVKNRHKAELKSGVGVGERVVLERVQVEPSSGWLQW